jgi:autotransporter passenger strand-loop-strand repeat protein
MLSKMDNKKVEAYRRVYLYLTTVVSFQQQQWIRSGSLIADGNGDLGRALILTPSWNDKLLSLNDKRASCHADVFGDLSQTISPLSTGPIASPMMNLLRLSERTHRVITSITWRRPAPSRLREAPAVLIHKSKPRKHHVSSGAVVTNDTLEVLSGGIAVATIDNDGILQIDPGGVASGTIVISGGDQQVYSGGVASGTILSNGDQQVDGVANGTMVRSG